MPRATIELLRAAGLAFLLAVPAAGEDPNTSAGIDAAVRSDWAAACEAFAKVEGDPRSGLRLAAAREQAKARLIPAVDELLRKRRWPALGEVVACGLAVDPAYYRFRGAAKRLEQEGVAALPAADARLRPWATYGRAFGEARWLIEGGADFLVKTQEEDGAWKSGKHGGGNLYDAGVTALALLALLPHRPAAAGRAAAALLRMRGPRGHFGPLETHSWMYNHCLATEALSEHAVRAGRQDDYHAVLRRAVEIILDAQNPGAGWRYEPRGNENDTCVTVRAAAALDAARRAGVPVDAAGLGGARAWVESMTDEHFGQIGYNFKGGMSARPEGKQELFPPEHTQSMTAAGCVVYLLAGDDPFGLMRSFSLVHEIVPRHRYVDMYYWELGARACVGGHGRMPQRWYEALVESAVACRAEDGGMRARGVWGADGGRIYATAMCILALAAPYTVAPSPKLSAAEFLRSGPRILIVPGWAEAVPTGVYVESGMVLKVEARGGIVPFADGPGIPPEGTRKPLARATRKRESKAAFGCLLGQVDDGKPFALKPGETATIRGYGHLWLLVNDAEVAGNYGSWEVSLEFVR